jgi:hypothetical protein
MRCTLIITSVDRTQNPPAEKDYHVPCATLAEAKRQQKGAERYGARATRIERGCAS